ncbi:hypothetical protein C4573_03805 [Candidatus Woesearchaeota archaeon]|nr:MAG: hypothetical protein C4573_03805 [Candidatus Woesearchaeota archaeon]
MFVKYAAIKHKNRCIKIFYMKNGKELKILKLITAKSKLTKEDAIEIGKKIKKSMHRRYKKEYPDEFK